MTWNEGVVKTAHGSQEAECSPEDVAAAADDRWEPQGREENQVFWIQGQSAYWGAEETCSSAGSHRTYQRYRQGGDNNSFK